MPYSLIGHSGGGQILSRLAAFIGSDAQRIVIANPSSHVWPDFRPAPYGLGGVFDARSRELALRTYLALPVTIYVGTADTGAKDLDQRPEAMRQGATRYERGRRVFEAAQEAARRHGWASNWRLVLALGVAHRAKEMLAPRAWEALQPE